MCEQRFLLFNLLCPRIVLPDNISKENYKLTVKKCGLQCDMCFLEKSS